MARRERRADIAEVGALIFRRPEAPAPAAPVGTPTAPASAPVSPGPSAAPPPAAPPTSPPAPPGRVPGGQLASHPATAERADRRTRRDVFDLDPRRIVEEGPYIREWDAEGEPFERLVAAVAARGEVDTPIWVRSQGPAGQRRFVLVAGKGRLRAALRTGLAVVPVRDLGELTDQQAVARQVEENLNRQDMTPAETAHALWRMHGYGESISEIGRRLHRDKGYVSYMVRVGEAVAALAPAEQTRLASPGALQVRQCQAIGALPDVAARAAELRRLLAAGSAPGADAGGAAAGAASDGGAGEGPAAGGAASGARRSRARRGDEASAFYGRALRNGRTFRMRWVESELRAAPAAVAEGFVSAMKAEGAALLAALRRLEAEPGRAGRAAAAELTRARQALERLVGD